MSLISSCTTTYVQYRGECITQQWQLAGVILRQREICELPPPSPGQELEDKKPISPYPDFLDRDNKADTLHKNLLEKSKGYLTDDDIPDGEGTDDD